MLGSETILATPEYMESEGEGRQSDWPVSPLEARLRCPVETVPLAALPGRWFHQRVEVLVSGQGALAGDATVVGRLRGAWGRALMTGASEEALAGAPCPWSPPCALDPLFRDQGRITSRLAIPRPYVLTTSAVGPDLLVSLTVFGFACDWIDAAADALVAGMRHGDPAPLGATVAPIDRRIVTRDAVAVPEPGANSAVLAFQGPLAFRDGGDLPAPNARTLISGLGNRVSGMARWQDTAVDADWRAIAEHAEGLSFDASDLRITRWERRSSRQNGRRMPLGGWVGRVIIGGDLAPIMPLLALGATCHVGSHTALGLGAYTLSMGGG